MVGVVYAAQTVDRRGSKLQIFGLPKRAPLAATCHCQSSLAASPPTGTNKARGSS
jgi:hypothetical protein